MTDRRPTTLDMVRELTTPHTHVETYQTRSLTGGGLVDARHTTRAPALLTQLWANDVPSNTVETGTRPGFASKPAARLDAHDTAVRIDLEAARWVRDLGEDDHHVDTAATVRQLHALAVSADPTTRDAIARDVRRWWTQARIVTGWDSPPWTPDNTCPQCGERGTLKIRLAERIGMCTHDACRSTWDVASIGLLADHIRAEAADARPTADPAGACWCPWPKPVDVDLAVLCRRCGSARCTRALQQRLLATLRDRAS